MVGEGDGTPLQYSCLETPMDRGAWWATVHGVAKSLTGLSNFTFTFMQIDGSRALICLVPINDRQLTKVEMTLIIMGKWSKLCNRKKYRLDLQCYSLFLLVGLFSPATIQSRCRN